MIELRSLAFDSISVWARTIMWPRPSLYACKNPARPQMMPPVGKSGPCTIETMRSNFVLGCLMSWIVASTSSRRLCGGMWVAMPTAMPFEPFTSRFGAAAARYSGSSAESS